MQSALTYANQNFDHFVERLFDLLRIPSISTDSDYAGDVRKAAEWIADELSRIGVSTVEVCETPGHPIVFAHHSVDDSLPTVLVYGHYDVQPPDPLDLWKSAPFEPEVRDGQIYARGSCDDKGQVFMHIKAIESWIAATGSLPVNIKLIIEGEEESGSENLATFIRQNKERLSADIVVISDTAMFAAGVPSITSGLRGLAYTEVILTGPDRDLHSGVYGGAVENPINVLCSLIGRLHDEQHRVAVPGFYDGVVDLTADERKAFEALPFDDNKWMASVGIKATRTETGYSIHEAITARPTLDVNGIWGGYQGKGAKTVLPSLAGAKISMRLVPGQDSEKVVARLKKWFEDNTPATMKLDFRNLHGGKPVLVDTTSPAMKSAAHAMEDEYGQRPYFTREGGSIPVVADFKEILGLDTVLMGFGLNSDAIHSPNEHYGLDRFGEGIRCIIRFLEYYGQAK